MSQSATGGPAITLYRLQACPYCERVVRTLRDHDLDYRSRFVEPMHSDRDAVKRISGKRTVPAIVDENTGVTMSESANIVDYIENTYGDVTRTDGGRAPADEGGER
ncbi:MULTISPECIES: glutathione S-transferase N-terminal domain-containing protein [Halorussus]|uniref:glutaredoxin family protein n=1 Tax=Halorussus TaxID=1070314 RepID=UPI000E21998A|nr:MULTISPECIES: glutathione S-transferase N-terminal domain-containing protein [Halorussus]NHN60626.1 glutaredoxin [Halorussus sp. JP-T4]